MTHITITERSHFVHIFYQYPPPPVCVNNYYYSTSYAQFFNTNFLSLRGAKRRANRGILSESGRSLTEMLGVLAVMGVLTIGAIAGFNYAMNKQRTNATVEYVNELAVLGTGQMLAGGTPKLLDYPDHTPSGYPAKITTDKENPTAFYIEIDQVPTPVCNEIISRLDGWKMVNDIGFFDGIQDCPTEPANMWFEIFATADKGGDTGLACTSNADCQGLLGTTRAKCNAHGKCEENCTPRAQLTAVGCCGKGAMIDGGCCRNGTLSDNADGKRQCCISYVTDKTFTYCCPAGTFPTDEGECISCADPRSFLLDVTYSACKNACPQRTLSGHTCLPPGNTCAEGAVLVRNQCHCPMDNPIMATDGSCHPADWEGIGVVNPPAGLVNYPKDWGAYYNRWNRWNESLLCPAGKFCSSSGQSVRLTRTDGKIVGYSGAFDFECSSIVNFSELHFQAWCKACGGNWEGAAWNDGTCSKP